MPHSTQIAIIGAGIVGLAHALAAAKKGFQVTVFDRHSAAVGASIRNFGMVWPVGQPAGKLLNRALRSRDIWLEVATATGIYLEPGGSLHVAYREDELAVLEEFVASTQDAPYQVKLLTAEETVETSPAVVPDGLLGALYSTTEVVVDPREAIATLPSFLQEKYGVTVQWNTAVTAIDPPRFKAGEEWWTAEHIFVCSGMDFETLYPQVFADSGMTKVKLQMMRTVPQPHHWRIKTSLAAGLTLTHYTSFAHCPSLPALKHRIQTETPHFPQWGIHVMVSQNAVGELALGDTHEYGLNPDPFDRAYLNQYVLNYLQTFARIPDLAIAETWSGVYAKRPGATEFIAHPNPGVTIVNGLSGAGMTLSFGCAEEVLAAF